MLLELSDGRVVSLRHQFELISAEVSLLLLFIFMVPNVPLKFFSLLIEHVIVVHSVLLLHGVVSLLAVEIIQPSLIHLVSEVGVPISSCDLFVKSILFGTQFGNSVLHHFFLLINKVKPI